MGIGTEKNLKNFNLMGRDVIYICEFIIRILSKSGDDSDSAMIRVFRNYRTKIRCLIARYENMDVGILELDPDFDRNFAYMSAVYDGLMKSAEESGTNLELLPSNNT